MDGIVNGTGTITGALSSVETLSGSLSPPASMSGELSIPTYIDVDIYDGPTEITPGEEEQMLETQNKTLTNRITIQAIPRNYGKVTWDGSKLTIT